MAWLDRENVGGILLPRRQEIQICLTTAAINKLGCGEFWDQSLRWAIGAGNRTDGQRGRSARASCTVNRE
jgi:hypothetical protein